MSTRTRKLALKIATTFPDLATREISYDDRAIQIDCTRGPVVAICDGYTRGIALSVQGLDCDNIQQICKDLCEQVLHEGIDLGVDDGLRSTLFLSATDRTPIFDEADFCTGMILNCIAIERSTTEMAVAA
jgi:hypothetical protein